MHLGPMMAAATFRQPANGTHTTHVTCACGWGSSSLNRGGSSSTHEREIEFECLGEVVQLDTAFYRVLRRSVFGGTAVDTSSRDDGSM